MSPPCGKIDRPRRKPVSPIEKALQICQSSEMVHEDDIEIKFINIYKGRGVFAKRPFQNGEFLHQYRGELVLYKEGESRLHNEGMGSFLFFIGRSKCNDATNCDGLGPMVNDSIARKQSRAKEMTEVDCTKKESHRRIHILPTVKEE